MDLEPRYLATGLLRSGFFLMPDHLRWASRRYGHAWVVFDHVESVEVEIGEVGGLPVAWVRVFCPKHQDRWRGFPIFGRAPEMPIDEMAATVAKVIRGLSEPDPLF